MHLKPLATNSVHFVSHSNMFLLATRNAGCSIYWLVLSLSWRTFVFPLTPNSLSHFIFPQFNIS